MGFPIVAFEFALIFLAGMSALLLLGIIFIINGIRLHFKNRKRAKEGIPFKRRYQLIFTALGVVCLTIPSSILLDNAIQNNISENSMIKASIRNYDEVSRMLEMGAPVDSSYNIIQGNHQAKKGEITPLYYVCTCHFVGEEKLDIAELLIESGANVNAYCDEENGDTVLIGTSRWGKSEYVELLVKNGADVNAVNNDGETALIVALENECFKNAECLLQNGADASVRSNDGKSTVQLIEENFSGEEKEILIELSGD